MNALFLVTLSTATHFYDTFSICNLLETELVVNDCCHLFEKKRSMMLVETHDYSIETSWHTSGAITADMQQVRWLLACSRCDSWWHTAGVMADDMQQVWWLMTYSRCDGWWQAAGAISDDMQQVGWLMTCRRCDGWWHAAGAMADNIQQVRWLITYSRCDG